MSNDQLAKLRNAKKQVEPAVKPQTEVDKGLYVNTVLFSGRLGKDPTYTATVNGKELLKSSFALFNPGNKDHSTMWFDLVMWLSEEKDNDNTEEFTGFSLMEKGQEVMLEGRLTMRMWEGKPYYTITIRHIS